MSVGRVATSGITTRVSGPAKSSFPLPNRFWHNRRNILICANILKPEHNHFNQLTASDLFNDEDIIAAGSQPD